MEEKIISEGAEVAPPVEEIEVADEPKDAEAVVDGGDATDADEKSDGVDYARLIEEDLATLRNEFPEVVGLETVHGLKNPVRFGALRDLGLTPREAFLASGGAVRARDNRAHLIPSVPRGVRGAADAIPRHELDMARAIFTGMSDTEIQKLYRKVTK